MEKQSFAALDFEHLTSNQHTACSVGLVIVKNNVVVQEYYSLINPPEDDGFENGVSGVTREICKDAPLFPEVWKAVSGMIGNLQIVAHNCSTEKSVINKACKYYDMGNDVSDKFSFIDTYTLTKKGLDESCKEYNIPLGEHHNPLDDATACAMLYMKLKGEDAVCPIPKKKRAKRPDVKADDIAEYKKRKQDGDGNKDVYEPLPEEEIAKFDNQFAGKYIVLSGNYDRFPDRDGELKRILKGIGVRNQERITNKTNILVIGKGYGWAKKEDAEKRGIQIVSEETLYEVLKSEGKL